MAQWQRSSEHDGSTIISGFKPDLSPGHGKLCQFLGGLSPAMAEYCTVSCPVSGRSIKNTRNIKGNTLKFSFNIFIDLIDYTYHTPRYYGFDIAGDGVKTTAPPRLGAIDMAFECRLVCGRMKSEHIR